MKTNAAPAKKMPVRMCVGCREHKLKKELIRVVRSPQGEISLDFTGKKSGRGAYLCPNSQCLAKARKTRQLEHTLDTSIPDEVYRKLEEELAARQEQQD